MSHETNEFKTKVIVCTKYKLHDPYYRDSALATILKRFINKVNCGVEGFLFQCTSQTSCLNRCPTGRVVTIKCKM